jgi:uncharacterized damage-inducible protein DinB
MVRVQTVLDSWKSVRQDTAQAVEDFPAAEMGYKPVADLASFGEIAHHILVAGHGLTGMLLDGHGDMTGPQFRETLMKYAPQTPASADAATLAADLRKTVDERCAALAARDEAFYSGIITRFDGQQVTRLEMVQFVKEHELTHRQQLFTYLRLKGIVPSTTRRRQAKQK